VAEAVTEGELMPESKVPGFSSNKISKKEKKTLLNNWLHKFI
jgi:hypothetical protein